MENIQEVQPEEELSSHEEERVKIIISPSPFGKVLQVACVAIKDVAHELECTVTEDVKINQLVLERTSIDTKAVAVLTRLLQRRDRTWYSVKFVDCHQELIEENTLQALLESMTNVKRLFLQTTTNNRETEYFFLPVQAGAHVPCLRLCVRNLSSALASKLAETLKTTTKLLDLSLSGSRRCGLQTDILAEAFSVNQSLHTLDLGDCMLDDFGMCRLVSALHEHRQLKQLDLSQNSWSHQTLKTLKCLLVTGTTPLKVLDLSMQRRPVNISLLTPALESAIVGLKQLLISNSGLTDDEVFPLIVALTKNKTLESLDLSKNRELSDDFLIHLAEHLPQINLKVLNICKLQAPNGSPNAMRALSEGVRSNSSLQLLRLLFWKQLVPACQIQIYINLNRGGRRALEENIPLALWPRVFERAQRKTYYCPLVKQLNAKEDAMFFLLRNEPALWQS